MAHNHNDSWEFTCMFCHSSCASLILVISKKFLLLGMPMARMLFWCLHSLKCLSNSRRPLYTWLPHISQLNSCTASFTHHTSVCLANRASTHLQRVLNPVALEMSRCLHCSAEGIKLYILDRTSSHLGGQPRRIVQPAENGLVLQRHTLNLGRVCQMGELSSYQEF